MKTPLEHTFQTDFSGDVIDMITRILAVIILASSPQDLIVRTHVYDMDTH